MPTVSLRHVFSALVALALIGATPPGAAAQQPEALSDVLTFLITNRAVTAGDFGRDEAAAISTRDTIANFVALELSSLPIASSAVGFSYALDPTLGALVRRTEDFGPFFTERSMTLGIRQVSYSVSYRRAAFDNIAGRKLRDGTLVSTSSSLAGEATPFDVERVALRLGLDSVIVAGTIGWSDRLDLGAAIPYARVTLGGERWNTYRGSTIQQAGVIGSAAGFGDVVLRAKYGVRSRAADSLSVGGDLRLPTGDKDNLLGGGKFALTPRLVASHDTTRFGVHGELGYMLGGVAGGVRYSAALTVPATPRVTLVGELVGSGLKGLVHLDTTTRAHPRLPNVSTQHLIGQESTVQRAQLVTGVKWSLGGSWLVSGNIVTPLTSGGMNPTWAPTLMVDYAFNR